MSMIKFSFRMFILVGVTAKKLSPHKYPLHFKLLNNKYSF